MKRLKIATAILFCVIAAPAISQVGIGTTNPHQSAILELSSTEQGLLLPRVGTDKRLRMTPVNGLILYDTDMKQFYVYENDAWSPVVGGGGDGAWIRNGSTGVTSLFNPSDRVGIGLTNPAEQLQITYSFRMPMSTTAAGNIYKDGNLFLHNFGTNNTFLGVLSGNLSLTGSHNTGLGYKTLNLNTTGLRNTALGSGALGANTTGSYSVAVGYNALQSQTGQATDNILANVAIGYEALASVNPTMADNGRHNVAIGHQAGSGITIGKGNVLLGYLAGRNGTSLTDGNDNVIIGYKADAGDGGHNNVVLIGSNTLATNKNQVRLGDNNIGEFFCMGAYAATSTDPPNLTVNSSGQIMRSTASLSAMLKDADGDTRVEVEKNPDEDIIRFTLAGSERMTLVGNRLELPQGATPNLFIGMSAGKANSTGYSNTAVGDSALRWNTTGYYNTAGGYQALWENTSGNRNTAFGMSALAFNVAGNRNTSFGALSLATNDSGSYNTAVGYGAMNQNTADSNTAIGYFALSANTEGSANIAVGSEALFSNGTGHRNVAMGLNALHENTTGSGNIAIGAASLHENITGSRNIAIGTATLQGDPGHSDLIAIGDSALFSNGTGPLIPGQEPVGNIAIGSGALKSNTYGQSNLAFGKGALYQNTTGKFCIAIGENALQNNGRTLVGGQDGSFNIAIGNDALKTNVATEDNLAIGNQALSRLSPDNGWWNTERNVAIGNYSLRMLDRGRYNTAVGHQSMGSNEWASGCVAVGYYAHGSYDSAVVSEPNVAIGYAALQGDWEELINHYGNVAVGAVSMVDVYSGSMNTGVGYASLNKLRTGQGNAALGYRALENITSGKSNVAIGNRALNAMTKQSNNTAVGDSALMNNYYNLVEFHPEYAVKNTAIGAKSMLANTTGYDCTAVGMNAMAGNTTGSENAVVGKDALLNNTTGSQNTAIGTRALRNNSTGAKNVAVGFMALGENTTSASMTANVAIGCYAGGAITTAYGNVLIGENAGRNVTTGTNNVWIGKSIGDVGTVDYDNSIAIGHDAPVDANNKARIGNSAVSSIGGQVNWTAFSDGRFKKDLKEDVPGLQFISLLRPITYNVDLSALNAHYGMPPQVDRTDVTVTRYTGFVAQEVAEAAEAVGYDFSGVDNSSETLGLRYAEFVVPLVKAVQEQQAIIEQLLMRIEELEKR